MKSLTGRREVLLFKERDRYLVVSRVFERKRKYEGKPNTFTQEKLGYYTANELYKILKRR